MHDFVFVEVVKTEKDLSEDLEGLGLAEFLFLFELAE